MVRKKVLWIAFLNRLHSNMRKNMKSVSISRLLLLAASLVGAEGVSAATYYVCDSAADCNAQSSGWNTGSDSNTCTTKDTACKSLRGAIGKMSGGDTVIIGDGTYSDTNNSVNSSYYPPYGNPDAWTVIKAEHDGGAVFDRASFVIDVSSGDRAFYWQLEGLVWANARFMVSYGHHVKVLRCGGYNAGSGNTAQFIAGKNASYILFEDSYAWGEGRYKFLAWQNSNIIMRRCVARLDKEDAVGEPIAGLAMYSVANGKIQNSIVIDSDVQAYWTNVYSRNGCFYVPTTAMDASNITIENSVCLNSQLGGAASDAAASDTIVKNNVFWKVDIDSAEWANYSRSRNPKWFNNTFGVSTTNLRYLSGYNSSGMEILNNIFYGIGGGGLAYNWGTHDYNAFYGSVGLPSPLSSHETADINPIWNASTNPTGALKYITRIEPDSSLSGLGSGGANIGATVMKMVGMSGTLWGETGYDVEQSTNMWPFPNESIIKSKMASYVYPGISGARGFAASGTGLYGGPITLTSYIWEYLGNPCPADICSYNSESAPLPAPRNLRRVE